MTYIPGIISKDEKLHGIARLHWIYVVQGIAWFLVMAGAGWAFNSFASYAALNMAAGIESAVLPAAMMKITHMVMYFLMGGGFFLFLLLVMKVLFTEVGISDRRVMHKTGMIFIKVNQVDLEEIRGEHIDLGYLGRFLGYGYIMMDCRFIGDVRLPALENPERFIRALHTLRAGSQDSLSLVARKGDKKSTHLMRPDEEGNDGPQPEAPRPEIEPGKQPEQPEVQPDNVPPRPEIPVEPTPHAPSPDKTPGPSPEAPPPQPAQPIPAPPPTEPPLQPPSDNVSMDPQEVTQVVAAVLPQMAERLVKELKEQGMLQKPCPENDNDNEAEVDNDLASVFDHASLDDQKRKPDDPHDKLEHSIH